MRIGQLAKSAGINISDILLRSIERENNQTKAPMIPKVITL